MLCNALAIFISKLCIQVAPIRTVTPVTPVTLFESGEFRSRASTAPVVGTLKRRKDRERTLANMIDNNNDGKFFNLYI